MKEPGRLAPEGIEPAHAPRASGSIDRGTARAGTNHPTSKEVRVRWFIALILLLCANLACSHEDKEMRFHSDMGECYMQMHSDQEYKDCMRARGWRP